MLKILIASLFAASYLAMGGCNTVEGAGQDMSAAGHKVSNEAAEHK